MIRRLAKEDEEKALASQRSSTDTSSASETFDKLDLTSPGSAMSTVFGSESGASASGSGSKRSSSRSPSRRGSSGGFSLPFHRRQSSNSGLPADDQKIKQQQQQSDHDYHLTRWITTGNVIYKSVGLGLMDLVVGFEIVKLAKERGVGNHIEGFS